MIEKVNSYGLDFNRFQASYIMFDGTKDYNFVLNREYKFNPDTIINSHTIVGIQAVINTEQLNFTTGNLRKDAISYQQLSGGILYVRDKNNVVMAQIPLTSLTLPANNGKYFPTHFVDHKWELCSIRFMANSGGLGNSIGLKFNVYLK